MNIPVRQSAPELRWIVEIESTDDARMGLAVLVDCENRLNSSAALRCLLSRMPEIDEAITPELSATREISKHRPLLPTRSLQHAFAVPAAVAAKSVRAGTTGNQGVTAVTGERGVRSPLPLRLAEGNNGKS